MVKKDIRMCAALLKAYRAEKMKAYRKKKKQATERKIKAINKCLRRIAYYLGGA